jgi:putative CocE/NonD family hydrolase
VQEDDMATLSIDTDSRIPVRDGTELAAHVVRPGATGRHPAIVFRTPYDRTTFASVSLQVHALAMAREGYAVVLQDVRGRGESAGDFEPFVNEQADGVDTIRWVAEQPWCDGTVGTVGISYNAFSQVAAAASAPEPLAAWMPALTPFDVRTSWVREGGAFNYGFNLAWMLGGIAAEDRRTRDPAPLLSAFGDPRATSARNPHDQPELASTPGGDAYFGWLAADDPYPGDLRVPQSGDLGGVAAPALVVAGWFDVFQPGSLELYGALASEAGHLGHGLVAGPWDHTGLPFKRRSGERDHGTAAMLDYHALQLAWFDAHLRGAALPDTFHRVFVSGADEWLEIDAWPPPGTTRAWDLNPDGTIGSSGRGGETEIVLDEAHPTPALGGRPYPWEPLLQPGVFDQRSREARSDVAVFTSPPLERPLRVAGPASVETVVVAESEGTDVVVTLSDVDDAGETLNARISLGGLAHEFRTGHRVRLAVAAAAHPRFDVFGGAGRRLFLTGPGYSRLILPEVS